MQLLWTANSLLTVLWWALVDGTLGALLLARPWRWGTR